MGFVPLSPLSDGFLGKPPVALREFQTEYWLEKTQKSMDRCTGHHDIIEIMFKTALNNVQSVSRQHLFMFFPTKDKCLAIMT